MASLKDLAKMEMKLPSGGLQLRAPKLGFRGGQGSSGVAVGLDVQPGYVAAVVAKANGRLVIERAAGRPLPSETVREGEVLDESLLTDALRELFKDGGLPKRVRLGIANQRTVLRVIEMPPIDDRKALEAAVRFQAQDHMPMPLQHAVLDFQPLGIVETPAGPRQRVVVVAAQREMVSRLLSAVEAAGLKAVGVDLSAFAMIRALHRAADGNGDGAGGSGEQAGEQAAKASTLYLNVGGLTNLAIAEGLACRFTRMVSGGLESMAAQLAERHSIALADARELLGTVNLSPAPAPQAPAVVSDSVGRPAAGEAEARVRAEGEGGPDGADDPAAGVAEGRPAGAAEHDEPSGATEHDEPSGATEELTFTDAAAPERLAEEAVREDPAAAEARVVLSGGVREIAGEVRNSLDFHRSQGGGEVRGVVLSGAALEIEGFAEALESELGFRLTRRSVDIDGGERLQGVSAQRLTIAAGLAVEEAPQ
jgi:type IV pilus assembly protein PilM